MKKLLAAVLSLCLALSLCAIPAMAAANLSTTLIEECLTSEVSTAITKNFTLPATWNEAPITWESSDPSVIQVSGNTAVVTRGIEDATVTLTATDAANPEDTKVLTFTVLSLFKKVWYNNNFYAPERYSADDTGLTFGHRKWVAAGNQSYTNVVGNNPYEFVEKTSEAGTGQAGFFRFGEDNNVNERIKVVPHPIDANDYAILLENAENSKIHYFGFALPSFTNDELPSGDVQVSFRLSSGSASQKWMFGFNSKLIGTQQHVVWRYNNAVDGATTYTTWNEAFNETNNPGVTSPGTSAYQNSPIKDIPTVGDYLDASVTFGVKTANTELACLKTSAGKINISPYIHSNKIEGKNGTDADKVFKSITFASPNLANTTALYVDDIVITTETTEIPGETAAEKLAVYKRLLTGKLNEAIADKAHVTDDINLNLLPNITGYDVAWASDNTSAIVIDTVNKKADVQLTEIIKNVTLTGTITHDGETATITLPLTVKPYGSSTVSVVDGIGSATGKVTYENAEVKAYTSSGDGALNDMNKTAFSVAQEDGNKFATVTGTADAIQSLKYGSGSWSGSILGTYKTISFDAKINKPTVDESVTTRCTVTIGTQSGYGIAQLIIPYVVNADGTYSKSKWYIADGGNNTENFRYVDDVKLETLPGLDEWFNIQIVTNTISSTYDIYVNGVKLFDHAAKFPAGQGDSVTARFYILSFNAVASLKTDDYKLTTICWDNIEILNNDAGALGNVSADLMLASIDSVNDTLAAAGTNGTAIAWTATGDAAISGNALVKSKDFGLGETTVTATATTAKGTLSRVYNLYYGAEIKAVDAADGMLNSIKYVSDVDAAGYIAYYDGDNALLRVAPIALQAGRNTRVFEEVTLPEGCASLKVFAWNENLSPLSFAYPAN